MRECCLQGDMVASGKYEELLEGSSLFSRLLDDPLMDTDWGEEKGEGDVKVGIPLVLGVLLLRGGLHCSESSTYSLPSLVA
jgi:hypothetical protein